MHVKVKPNLMPESDYLPCSLTSRAVKQIVERSRYLKKISASYIKLRFYTSHSDGFGHVEIDIVTQKEDATFQQILSSELDEGKA